jgi:DNA ligase (NAD+)
MRIGSAPSEQFAKVKHARPMLSLSNIFDPEEVGLFIQRINRFLNLSEDEAVGFTAEPKIDGLSISLRYEKGRLISAATRGDGTTGEDVTQNIRTISDIPSMLPETAPDICEIRGEIYMTKTDFHALNIAQGECWKKSFCKSQKCGCWLAQAKRCTNYCKEVLAFLCVCVW